MDWILDWRLLDGATDFWDGRRDTDGDGGAGRDEARGSRVGDRTEFGSDGVGCAERICLFWFVSLAVGLGSAGGLLANSWACCLGGGRKLELGDGNGEEDGGLLITRCRSGGSRIY